ncbi:hypothetical protein AGMMS49942_02860 [Spirochaetia bacterium]|nr:hypothetical protein AGMMS49942_02860 [Spirochaetia bacterium]
MFFTDCQLDLPFAQFATYLLKCIYIMCILSGAEEKNMYTTSIAKWGNSQAVRLPAEITRRLELKTNDQVFLKVEKDADLGPKLTITKVPGPKEGTIEYLFKDYSGESFKTELINPEEPAGKEQW